MKNELGLKIIEIFSLDKKLLKFSGQQKLSKELNALHSGPEKEELLYKKHIAGKVGNVIGAAAALLILLFILWMNPQEEHELLGNAIKRNDYAGTEKSIYLTAKSEGMEENLELLIEPRHYSKSQLDEFAQELFEYLPKYHFYSEKVTGEGVYVIKEHIKLPTQIEGYPFEVGWESSDYEVMNNEGSITLDSANTSREVVLTATLSCYEYTWKNEYRLLVHKPIEMWETGFSKKLSEVIEELDNATAEKEELVLPAQIDGHQIAYEESDENTIPIVLGVGITLLVFLWILPDNTLSKQMEERNRQLSVDYVKLVSKLTLYMGAGLSFRSALARILRTADKNRFYAKEMELVMREIENGISEYKAIGKLAERCKIPCYTKLAVLLNQNIRKGNNNLQKQLKEEMDKAFEERKNLARKYAEEAGTKLLFPMVLMLLVVIVMIMYPAFVSFTI